VPASVGEVYTGAPVNISSVIGVGDVLSVTVYREPDASLASVAVDPMGVFQMPLLGEVIAAGKTPAALARELTTALDARYIVDPKVSVNIVSFGSRKVTVDGAVGQPGALAFEQGLTLVGAVAQARGTTRVARTDRVAVFRGAGNDRYVGVFDLQAIRIGRAPDVELQPGDTIVVGVSGARQTWQDVLQAAPLVGIFTRF
jgi:polysaccharide export outer membrane protein